MKYKVCVVGYLMLAVVLLTGSTIRIPPSRPGALRVQSAGVVGAGTGTDTGAPRDQLFREWINVNSNYTDNGAGTTRSWLDTSASSSNAVTSVDAEAPTKNSGYLTFDGSSDKLRSAYSGTFTLDTTGTTWVMRMRYKSTQSSSNPTIMCLWGASNACLWVGKYPGGSITAESMILFCGSSSLEKETIFADDYADSWQTYVMYANSTQIENIVIPGDQSYLGYGKRVVFNHSRGSYSVTDDTPIVIGDANGFASAFAAADIAGVRMYRRALTADEKANVKNWTW